MRLQDQSARITRMHLNPCRLKPSRLQSLFLITLLATSVAALPGCGKATFIVQQYDGSPLADEQVAILRLNGDEPVRLEALDGEPLGYELHDRASRVHIEMLPGEHELALAEGPDLPAKRRRFRAEAGKVYRPLLVRKGTDGPVIPGIGEWVVGIYEVNASSDEIVREISQVPIATTQPSVAPVTSNALTATAQPLGSAPAPSGSAPAPSGSAPAPNASAAPTTDATSVD